MVMSRSSEPGTSKKALGKRPAYHANTPAETSMQLSASTSDTSTQAQSGVQTRQKRVLPSRSRRGGPGVGSCDVDVMILDTFKRKFENEPLIPADTTFFLTTNSELVPSSSTSKPFEMELNSQAYERYFDRPEVIRAYREQQVIQTPEYSHLSEDASVGGRFRPRALEDDSTDTTDAAFEKRHRKYETFEKRQRLREKEKLKHEHYKLKERIEQLRAMDTSAFLALPASALGPADEIDGEQVDWTATDSPAFHVNGAAAYNEGERRRREMLNVAYSLEERYRLLLPSDKKLAEREKSVAAQRQVSLPVEPAPVAIPSEPEFEVEVELGKEEEAEEEAEVRRVTRGPSVATQYPRTRIIRAIDVAESDVEVEEERVVQGNGKDREEKIKLRIKVPAKENRAAASTVQKANQRKHRMSLPPPNTRANPTRRAKSAAPIPNYAQSLPVVRRIADEAHDLAVSGAGAQSISASSRSAALARAHGDLDRSSNGRFLPRNSRAETAPPRKRARSTIAPNGLPFPPPSADSQHHVEFAPFSVSAHLVNASPRRGQKPASGHSHREASVSTSRSHPSHGSGGGRGEQAKCVLMHAVMRTAGLPTARKTQRGTMAFGTKVPHDLEEARDFELPLWVHDPYGLLEDQHEEDQYEEDQHDEGADGYVDAPGPEYVYEEPVAYAPSPAEDYVEMSLDKGDD